MDFDAEGAANPKLPLWETICLSYSTYLHNFKDVLRISWLWLLVTAALTGAANWLQMSWIVGLLAELKPGIPPQMLTQVSRPIEAIVLGNVSGLIGLLAGISIAVAWHRRLLLDEPPGLSGHNVVAKSLWHYVGVSIVICLIVVLPALMIAMPIFLWLLPRNTGVMGLPIPFAISVFFLISVAAIAVMVRLSLLLPARAVGDQTLTFKDVWKRVRGNTWRMFWGIVACTLPPIFAAQIALLVLVGFPDPSTFASGAIAAQVVVTSTSLTVYYLLILPICIGFLSLAYQHFLKWM
jgi:hypothetical protein